MKHALLILSALLATGCAERTTISALPRAEQAKIPELPRSMSKTVKLRPLSNNSPQEEVARHDEAIRAVGVLNATVVSFTRFYGCVRDAVNQGKVPECIGGD